MKPDNGLYISKSNRRGVLLLLLIVLLITFTPRLYYFIKGEKSIEVSQELIVESQKLSDASVKRSRKVRSVRKSKFRSPPAKFDPNTYEAKDWTKLGLSQKQADLVLKFTQRGIRTPEDLKRIFVISDELFALLKDSLVFNAPAVHYQLSDKPYEKKKVSVELNLADKEQLMSISGIGDYISDRIINYRERLGGFAFKEQLMDIKKIDLELFSRIEDQIWVDTDLLRKININQVEVEELKSHPYISWNVANSIIKMRLQKVSFTKLEEILESALIDRELFEKIKPYLSL